MLDRHQLLAQRGDLLVENVDLRQRALGDLLLRSERIGGRARLVARRVGAGAALGGLAQQALPLALRSFERRGKRGDFRLVFALLRALHGEQAGQLFDLAVESGERRVLARHLARKEELRQHEHRQEKNDHQQHRRQRVDEARPIIHASVAASARQRHRSTPQDPPPSAPCRGGAQRASRSLASRRRSLRMSSCWADCASTQSRICCCSWRMCVTSN